MITQKSGVRVVGYGMNVTRRWSFTIFDASKNRVGFAREMKVGPHELPRENLGGMCVHTVHKPRWYLNAVPFRAL